MGSILTHKKKNEVDLGEMPAENTFDLNWVVWEASIARHKGKGVRGAACRPAGLLGKTKSECNFKIVRYLPITNLA